MRMLCNPDCFYLRPTEDEQTDTGQHHICARYGQRVYHLGQHPYLVSIVGCDQPRIKQMTGPEDIQGAQPGDELWLIPYEIFDFLKCRCKLEEKKKEQEAADGQK